MSSMEDNEEQSNFHLMRPSNQRIARRLSATTTHGKPEDLSFFPPNVDAYNIFPMKQEIFFQA